VSVLQLLNMNRRRALITGVTGQDGTYLAELLAEKNYEIFGIARRSSADICTPIETLRLNKKIDLIHGDIRDRRTIERAIEISKPDEVYNLASQSHVGISFDCPEETHSINYDSAILLIESALEQNPIAKIYQASSSEMFGLTNEYPQTEKTPFNPTSPYGESKVKAYLKCQQIRKERGAFVCSGITYNHESPRRPKNFVTRKISHSVAKIKAGKQSSFAVGNIYSERDWGYAEDYVRGIWSMMQQEKPDDFIIATGVPHTVKDFIETAANSVSINLEWVGTGMNEHAINVEDGSVMVTIDKNFYRPTDPTHLVGDASKAMEELGWQPQVKFHELVALMTLSDLRSITTYE